MKVLDLDAIEATEMTDDERRKAIRRALDSMVKSHIAWTRVMHREMLKYVENHQ